MKFGFSAFNTVLCENHFANEQQQKTDGRRNSFRMGNSAERKEEEEELRKLRKGERKVTKSVEQLELLRSFYQENPLPTPSTYQRIASQTGLTAR